MSQEHQVLRCFSCETFQVHIVKKSKKWECKVCGEKQSLKRNYGKGSGKDCRSQVMKLNELRALQGNGSKPMKGDETLEETIVEELGTEKSVKSKWTQYLDEDAANDEVDSEDTADYPSEIVLTKKKRRIKNSENAVKKMCRGFKRGCEPSSKAAEELIPSFPAASDGAFGNSDKKNMHETPLQEKNTEKHPIETKSALKHSKYAKYLDNSEATEVSKNSNIFNSSSVDLDNLLNL